MNLFQRNWVLMRLGLIDVKHCVLVKQENVVSWKELL